MAPPMAAPTIAAPVVVLTDRVTALVGAATLDGAAVVVARMAAVPKAAPVAAPMVMSPTMAVPVAVSTDGATALVGAATLDGAAVVVTRVSTLEEVVCVFTDFRFALTNASRAGDVFFFLFPQHRRVHEAWRPFCGTSAISESGDEASGRVEAAEADASLAKPSAVTRVAMTFNCLMQAAQMRALFDLNILFLFGESLSEN